MNALKFQLNMISNLQDHRSHVIYLFGILGAEGGSEYKILSLDSKK